MSLPNPSMTFTPFNTLPASDLNDLVENIEALADGSGLDDGAVTPVKTGVIPYCYVRRAAGFTVGDDNNSKVQFDTEVNDTDAMYNSGASTTRVTIVTPGIYAIAGKISYQSDSGGRRATSIYIDGVAREISDAVPGGAYTFSQQVVFTVPMTAGQYVELNAYHTGGNNLDVTASLTVCWIGKAA